MSFWQLIPNTKILGLESHLLRNQGGLALFIIQDYSMSFFIFNMGFEFSIFSIMRFEQYLQEYGVQ